MSAGLDEAQTQGEHDERERSSFLTYRNSAGLIADFHALRHTFVSRLINSGATVKAAQELARHSTPMLTFGKYAHISLVDRKKALDAMPSIEGSGPIRDIAKATGTYDAQVRVDQTPQRVAPTTARRGPSRSFAAIECQQEGSRQDDQAGAQLYAQANTCERLPTTAITAPDRIRTCDLRFRKPPLYPTELRAQQC